MTPLYLVYFPIFLFPNTTNTAKSSVTYAVGYTDVEGGLHSFLALLRTRMCL